MSDCTVLWQSQRLPSLLLWPAISKRIPQVWAWSCSRFLPVTREVVLANITSWGSKPRFDLLLKLSPKVPYFKGKAVPRAEMNDCLLLFPSVSHTPKKLSRPVQSSRWVPSSAADWPAEQDPCRFHKSPLISALTKHTRRLLAVLIRLWLLWGGLSMADSTGWNVWNHTQLVVGSRQRSDLLCCKEMLAEEEDQPVTSTQLPLLSVA